MMIAALREIQHERKQTKTRYGWDDSVDSPSVRFLSLCGEIAAARFLGLYWPLAYRKPVVPDLAGVEVFTPRNRKHNLLLHDGDTDEVRWLLVVGPPPEMEIVGWAWTAEIRTPENWAAHLPRPCYLFQQSKLRRDFWWEQSTTEQGRQG